MSEYLDRPTADLVDVAVPILKQSPTWEDMLEVFSEVMSTNVDSPIEQLERIRFISDSIDDTVLSNTARMLGFDFTQDVLNLNEDNLTKLVTQLPLYPDQNGTEYFTKFLGLLLNAQTDVEYLYTRDYMNFVEVPRGALVKDGGEWFKTTHVVLEINLFNLDRLLLSAGRTLFDRVKELFHAYAPVALVVERIDFVENFEDSDWLGGSAFGLATTLGYEEVTVVID
jgi:hypothetical protein